MRTREMRFCNYGLSDARVAELMQYCKEPENMEMVKCAAAYANTSLSDVLAKSLTTGMGYLRLICTDDIFYDKPDFYAYRRLTLALLDVLLKDGDPGFWKADVLEDWLESRGKRRRGRRHRPVERKVKKQNMQ